MTARIEYLKAREEQTRKNWSDDLLWLNVHGFTQELIRTNYVKNFTWMGIPILQYPTDMMVMQELIWEVKPEVIIETGMAFGGTAVFYASILDAIGNGGHVITVDKEVRPHNQEAIDNHPIQFDMDGYKWLIEIIEGDSVSGEVIEKVKSKTGNSALVILDSNHTHDHVLQELKLYSPLVSVGSYIVVFDTAIEQFMTEQPADRPWGPKNNPATAVQEFLKGNDEFEVDREVQTRALITAAPGGYLKRIKQRNYL